MNKKQVLFDLRNYIKFLTAHELNEVLNDDVLSIEETKHCLIIRFSGDRSFKIWNDANKFWYLNDQFHRENDQPAIIYSNGSTSWWITGRRHRENDQPAIIYSNGSMEWWVKGKRIK